MSSTHDFRSIGPHMARGALWMVAMRWVLRIIGLANVVILARLLAPEDFGIIAMATVVVGFLQMFADVNVDLVLIRNADAGRQQYDSAWTVQALSGLAIMLLLFALAPLMARYYGDDRVILVTWIISLKAAIIGFENVGVVEFRKRLDFRREFKYWVIRRLFTVTFTLVLALAMRNYMALAIAQPTAGLVTVILSYVMSDYRPRISFAKFGEIWSFSRWLIVYNTAGFVTDRVDEFIVGGIAGPVRLGHYFIAADVSTLPTREVSLPVSRALMPTLAKIAHDPAELRVAFRTVLAYLAVTSFSIGGGLAVVAEDLIVVVLGEKWLPAVPIFRWLAVYGAFAGLLWGLQPYFIVRHRERAFALLTAAHAIVLSAALTLTAVWFDLLEIAMVRTAVMALIVIVLFRLLIRAGDVGATEIVQALWRPALASGVMVLAVAHFPAFAGDTRVLGLAAEVALGAVVFGFVLIGLWLVAGRPAGPEATAVGLVAGLLRRRGPRPDAS